MSEFYQLTVAEVSPEADSAVCVNFDVPPTLESDFKFKHGQYLTLKRRIDGEVVQRSYSICSGLDDDELRIGIKHVEGGKFSTFANQGLQTGDVIDVMPPAGNFTCELSADNDKSYLCIAAGSGITPILAIVKSILSREPRSHVTLLFGNRRVSTIMFREELEQLKNRYMSRFQLIHILSREHQEVELLNGRINNRKGAELSERLLDLANTDEFFLCGPEAMISEVSRGLTAFGVAESKIHYELFGASADDAAKVVARHHERARRFGGKVCRVTVKFDGRETQIELTADGENILDAALDAGLDLPFACKGGVCATCKAKVADGAVEMDLNHALEKDELAQGFVLTCQAHPLTDEVLVDYDAAR